MISFAGGLPSSVRRVAETLRSGKGTHAYLIYGNDPGMADFAARVAVAGLLCEGPLEQGNLFGGFTSVVPSAANGSDGESFAGAGAYKPCGRCRGCSMAWELTHHRLLTLNPAAAETKKEEVDFLRRELYISTGDDGGRICFIRHAHRMNASSANSLLKVIEEPPPGVLFVLSTDDGGSMLDTIKSRCVPVYVPTPLVSEIREFLDGLDVFDGDSSARGAWRFADSAGVLFQTLTEPAAGQAAAFAALRLCEGVVVPVENDQTMRGLATAFLKAHELVSGFLAFLVPHEGLRVRVAGPCLDLAASLVYNELAIAFLDLIMESGRTELVLYAPVIQESLSSMGALMAAARSSDDPEAIVLKDVAKGGFQVLSGGEIYETGASEKKAWTVQCGKMVTLAMARNLRKSALCAKAGLSFFQGCDKLNSFMAASSKCGFSQTTAMADALETASRNLGISLNLLPWLEGLFASLGRSCNGHLVSG